jgi:general secretion pathway protein C
MPQTRLNEWLGRLPQNGPWLVSMALSALIAVEVARIALSLWGAGPVKSVLPASRPQNHAAQVPPVDVAAIVADHVFGIAPPKVQNEGDAPQSTANLVLAGTIATQDPKHGVAIISDGGPSKVYSIGDRIGGASLYSVYLDHVILDRGGTLETLKLPLLRLAGGPAILRRQIGGNPSTAANLENVRRLVQEDPSLLNEVLRAVASYDNKAGKLRGFRVYPGRNRSAFNSLGLRPGDLVTAINGTPLDDPQHGQEIFNTLQTASSAAVTIERGGQTIQVSMNIAQIATEANKELSAAPTAPPPSPSGLAQAVGAGSAVEPGQNTEPSAASPGGDSSATPGSGAPGSTPPSNPK